MELSYVLLFRVAGNFMAKIKKNKNRGFSLIELSIALVVFGLIMGGALSRYESYMKQKDYLTTLGRSGTIRVAMERFVTGNGRFPCPAGPALSYSDPNAGVENCSVTPGSGIRILTGFADTNNPSDPLETVPQPVLQGAIPYVTIGISYQDAFDGWGGALAYAVSKPQTDMTTMAVNRGGINLKVYDATSGSEISSLKNSLPANLDIVIFSYGKNGAGAYGIEGKPIEPCLVGAVESPNCSGTTAFFKNYDKHRSYGSNLATYYDDVFLLTDVTPKIDKWAQGNMMNMYNPSSTVNGKIGIGTTQPLSKIHVDGNIRVSGPVKVWKFCDPGGANCFPADIIGGTGVNCGSGVMTGIRSAASSCFRSVNLAASGVNPGTCPNGKFMTGVEATTGNIQCAAP